MKRFAHRNVSGCMDVQLDEGHIATVRKWFPTWDFTYRYGGWEGNPSWFWANLDLETKASWGSEHLPLLEKALRSIVEATVADLEKLEFTPPMMIAKYDNEGCYVVTHDIRSWPIGVSLKNTKHFFKPHVKNPDWSVAANWRAGVFQKIWAVGFHLGPEFDDLDPELTSEEDRERVLAELRRLLPPAVERARATALELLKGA